MYLARATLALLLVAVGSSDASAETVVPERDRSLRTGLVFAQGSFVPGPYVLTRSDTMEHVVVAVAGVELDRFRVGAPPIPVSLPSPSQYTVPPGVDTLRASTYPLYLQRLIRHNIPRLGLQRALDLAEADARACPLVQDVERHDDGLLLRDKESDPYYVDAGPLLATRQLTRDEARALAERSLAAYRELLSAGGAILHFSGVDVFLPAERVQDVLLPSLKILSDPALPEQSKREKLRQRWNSQAIVDTLLRGHRSTAALDAAIEPYRVERRP
jgi:hypothetical protein